MSHQTAPHETPSHRISSVHGVLNCNRRFPHSLPQLPAYGSLSGAGHTFKPNIDITLHRFLQLPPLLVKRRDFIETNCLSLRGAKSSECQAMKIHGLVIVIRCEGGGWGRGLTSLLSAVLSYCLGETWIEENYGKSE